MENRITVIVSSRSSSEEKKDFIDHVQKSCGVPIDMVFICNQGMPLSKVYHDYLDKATNKIVVLIHDDIEFLRDGWGLEVVRLFENNQDYGIIGVAGSAEFHEEAAWWRFKDIYGQVLHRNEGKSWLTAFSPLIEKDLEEVCVIDGLFMAVHKDRISKNFSEDLEGFNMYDVYFCLSNFLDGKTKIGVTTNIRLAHNSIGELHENWYTNRDKINQEFGENYPIYVKKNGKGRSKK